MRLDTAKGCSMQKYLETSSELSISVQFETRSRQRIAVLLKKVACNRPQRHTTSCLHRESGMHEDEGWGIPEVRLTPRVHRVVLTSTSQIGPEDQREQDAITSCDQPSGSKMPWATGSNTVDYRILGVPLSAIEQQDTNRKDKVKKLIEKFEIHPNKEPFLQDFKQTKEINEFSKKSHDLIADMNNTEILSSAKHLQNSNMQSTLAQAGGSRKSRGETCRQLRPRQQIGIETIGRRAVGIPSILHSLTIRDFFSKFGPVSVDWRKTSRQPKGSVNRTPTQTACTDAHSVSQHILNRMITLHHANTRGSRLHIFVSQNSFHPRVMSRSLPHLIMTTSTSSLSPTSQIFPTFSPTQPSPLAHDPYLFSEDPGQSGGSTQIPCLTGYEPKVIEPEDFEPRRIELDWNLAKIWMNLAKLVLRCPISSHKCIPIITQRKALQTRILKMVNYEKCWLHRCTYRCEEKILVLKNLQHLGNQKQKNDTEERDELCFCLSPSPEFAPWVFTSEMSPWNASPWRLLGDVNVAQKLESTLQPVYVHVHVDTFEGTWNECSRSSEILWTFAMRRRRFYFAAKQRTPS